MSACFFLSVSLDLSEISASRPSTSKCDFAFTPVINFTSELDPARVFTPPQPQGADKQPLSEMSVSEAQELKNALLESIAKCMQIQNSLYRLVLVKLHARVKDAGVKASFQFESRELPELPLNNALSAAVTEMKSKTSPDPSTLKSLDVEEGSDVSLNDATKTPNMKSLDDAEKNAGKEKVEMPIKALNEGNLEDTPGSLPEAPNLGSLEGTYPSFNTEGTEQHSDTAPGSVSSLDDTGATRLNDTPDATLEDQKEIPKDAFETLLNQLAQPLQALNRCTQIQRDLFHKLSIVNAITSKDGKALSGMR